MTKKNYICSVLAILLLPWIGCDAMAQGNYNLQYAVGVDTAAHYLNVDLTYTPQEGTHTDELVLNMPMWAPGYYEMLNFPKHLCDFVAKDAEGNRLTWRKEGMNRWRVQMSDCQKATISYRIYANRRDVASSRVDGSAAFIAPAGVFMHVDGDLNHPVSVTFQMPSSWQHISTGLVPQTKEGHTFMAKDFDTLYDSPFFLGNHYVKEFEHEGHSYTFAVETPEGMEDIGFEEDFKRIVSAATQLMGDVPYSNYCLIHMGKGGGGLEHLNSQACYTDGTYRFPSRRSHVKFLAFTAHEYFHLYNVKCIRPAELWPIDYNREAITPMLWVSEGLTCYYEFRLLRNAGIATPDEAMELLSTYFGLYAPYEGQRHQSLRQSSYDIWLNFMNDDDNERDVRVNYYFKGPVIGLLMDIDIRRKTRQQHSLDDVMRRLYQKYYKQLQRGFTEEEFWAEAADIAGQPLTDIRRFVDTTDDIDYDSYLREAGLYINTTDWTIRRAENPNKQQRQFLKAMNLRNDE